MAGAESRSVRVLAVVSAAFLLVVAAVCLARPNAAASAALLLQHDVGSTPSAQMRQLGGLISEVSAVKHALLAIESREISHQHAQQLAGGARQLPGNLPAPVHTDSFDYEASIGHQPLMKGEWSHRNVNDDRLKMIPRRSTLHNIDKAVLSAECHFPDCVTRSGLPPGSVLYPGKLPLLGSVHAPPSVINKCWHFSSAHGMTVKSHCFLFYLGNADYSAPQHRTQVGSADEGIAARSTSASLVVGQRVAVPYYLAHVPSFLASHSLLFLSSALLLPCV